MNFKYLDFKTKIIDNLEAKSDTLVVFSDYLLKNIYRDKKMKTINILQTQETFITFKDFQNIIFSTDKVIIRESKRILSLYSSLTTSLINDLNIENYYDFIDIGDEFFRYYTLKNTYLFDSLISLEPWQKNKIALFTKMKIGYDQYLLKNNLIPEDWIKNYSALNFESLSKYKKIIFVDIPYFTPLEKRVLRTLEKTHDIEFLLQCPPQDFDEENLELFQVSFDTSKKNSKIELFEAKEDIEILVNMINFLKNENNHNLGNDIFLPDIKNCNFHKLFPKYFTSNQLDILNDTNIFNFFKGQQELLSSLELSLKGSPLSLLILKKHIENKGFIINYNLTEEDILSFYTLLNQEYKYFSSELSKDNFFLSHCKNNFFDKLLKIHSDLLEISEFKSVKEFIVFFKDKINLFDILEKKYSDIGEKLLEAFSLAISSEFLNGENTLTDIFKTNVSSNIYRLIIKYLENIELSTQQINNLVSSVIKPLELAKENQTRDIFFINFDSNSLPKNENFFSFLTEKQKRDNNILTRDKSQLLEKYRFLQAVSTCNSCKIFYVKNSTQDISPFLNELVSAFKLQLSPLPIESEECLIFLKVALKSNEINDFKKFPLINKENHTKDFLTFNINEFKDKSLKIGAYDFKTLTECPFKFFLDKVSTLSYMERSISSGFTPRFLGIFAHALLENLTKKTYKRIVLSNDFSITNKEIQDELDHLFNLNRYKISTYLDNFFKEIFFPIFVENIKFFYSTLEKRFDNIKIKNFFSEKNGSLTIKIPLENDSFNFILSGRVDLLIETEKGNYIIDHKTGSNNDLQLDFYSIMLFGDETNTQKEIFNLMKGELILSEKIFLTKDSLKEILNNFIVDKKYNLSEKNSSCTYCHYHEICKKEIK
jgi:adenylate kinase family enzyme